MPSMKLTPSVGILTTKHENLHTTEQTPKRDCQRQKKRFFSDISKADNQSSGSPEVG